MTEFALVTGAKQARQIRQVNSGQMTLNKRSTTVLMTSMYANCTVSVYVYAEPCNVCKFALVPYVVQYNNKIYFALIAYAPIYTVMSVTSSLQKC